VGRERLERGEEGWSRGRVKGGGEMRAGEWGGMLVGGGVWED